MAKELKYWYLSNHQLFVQLSQEDKQSLCVISEYKKGRKGEVIIWADEYKESVFFLKRGLLKILRLDAQGNEYFTEIIQPGDIFGAVDLQSAQSKESDYARVISDEVAICKFLIYDFERVLTKNPTVALRFTKTIGGKLNTIQQRYQDLVFKDTGTRLREFLMKYVQANGKWEEKGFYCPNYFTHQDLADIISSTRQTVSSLLNDWKRQSLIILDRRRIFIPRDSVWLDARVAHDYSLR